MKFKSVKKVSELALDGVTFAMEQVDGQISSVTLTDKSGRIVRFAKHGYCDFGVFIPAIEKEKKWELGYELRLIGPRAETFDEKYLADNRRSELEIEFGSQFSNATLQEIEVAVSE